MVRALLIKIKGRGKDFGQQQTQLCQEYKTMALHIRQK
jgi:hypothetical protein